MTTAALVAAVVVWAALIPERRIVLPTAGTRPRVRGVVHVHSRTSDGRGSLDEIAAAAARAGLAFVVATDHGDGTRIAEPPAYRSGVLTIDAVEISTAQGHYIGVGLPRAPYPLGGDARDVVEDVSRLGGFGIAAHPDSPKAELAWSELQRTPIDALELINLDTTWRIHAFNRGPGSWVQLAKALLAYPLRPAESVTALLTDGRTLRREWAALTRTRRVVALAGADAHAKLALRDAEPGDNRFSIPIPSYEASFGVMSVNVTLRDPFTGNAEQDAAALLAGLRAGHAYVAVDGWASPADFEFTAESGGQTVTQGDETLAGLPMTLRVRSNAPEGFVTRLVRDGEPFHSAVDSEVTVAVDGAPAVYTVEVARPDREHQPPWIMSNPIYVRSRTAGPVREDVPRVEGAPVLLLHDGRSTAGWTVEHDPSSLAAIDSVSLVDGAWIRLRYGLSGGARAGQYAAASVDVPRSQVAPFEALAFSVRGERALRVSVQVRTENAGSTTARWQRSIFVDETKREYVVPLRDMRSIERGTLGGIPIEDVRSVMFVIDTTNTAPGRNGRLWVGSPALVRLAD